MSKDFSDNDSLRERLETILSALERIPCLFSGISQPSDFQAI